MSFIIFGEHGKRPEGTKEILATDLTHFYDRVIDGWRPQSQIWALTKGPGILAAASALSGIHINTIFRRKLRLQHYGQLSTYLPIGVIPAMMTLSFHKLVRFSITHIVYIRIGNVMNSFFRSANPKWNTSGSSGMFSLFTNSCDNAPVGRWRSATISIGFSINFIVCVATLHVPISTNHIKSARVLKILCEIDSPHVLSTDDKYRTTNHIGSNYNIRGARTFLRYV